MEAEPPELDAACVSRVLSFVHGAATMGAALRVSRLWRRCGRDATLPVWAEMDAARFRALHLGAAEPRFCACAVVHSLRRGAGRTLRRLDLSAATACNACSIHFFGRMGTDNSQRIARECNIFAELCLPGRAPALEELDVSRGDAPRGQALYGYGVVDQLLALGPQAGALPRLRAVNFARCALDGTRLGDLLARCPALEELNLADVPLSEEAVRLHIAPRPLRVQLNRNEPLPRAVDVTCGVCGVHLWRGLRQFAIAPPTQPHIDEEWYTTVPPLPEAVAPLTGAGNPRSLNCVRNCHAPSNLYLVDAGTGHVPLHGWRYAIAVGAGGAQLHGGRVAPRMAVITPVE